MWYKIPYWVTTHSLQCAAKDTIGVVFTGTGQRISEALKRLEKDYDHLLISGADSNFVKSTYGVRILQNYNSGDAHVYIESKSRNTEENARNTFKWLTSLGSPQPCAVNLITSEAHGVRATLWMLQTERESNNYIPIITHLVTDHTSNGRTKMREMVKTFAAVARILRREPSIAAVEKILDCFLGIAKRPQDTSQYKRNPRASSQP
jgi:uncharacterized SAM-binding protein YcdF (DUF218 family)